MPIKLKNASLTEYRTFSIKPRSSSDSDSDSSKIGRRRYGTTFEDTSAAYPSTRIHMSDLRKDASKQ